MVLIDSRGRQREADRGINKAVKHLMWVTGKLKGN